MSFLIGSGIVRAPSASEASGAPVNVEAPLLSGIEQVAQLLNVTDGVWEGTPPLSFTYQWMKFLEGGLVNIEAPVITGVEATGEILSVSTGVWEGALPISYSYQWYAATEDGGELVEDSEMVGDPIPGATSPTYVVGPEYAGERIFCEVTASNSVGEATAQSNLTGVIIGVDDVVPDAFAFTDQIGVEPSTVCESNAITVSGITVAVAISIAGGGEYQKNAEAWTAAAGTVVNGDTVKRRGTSSASPSTATPLATTIGGVSDTFSITTKAWDPSFLGAPLKLWSRIEGPMYSDAGITPVVDGATVHQWVDLSGNGNHPSMVTAGNRPSYDADILNSRPAVNIGGADDSLEIPFNLGGSTLSVFLIGMIPLSADNGRIVVYQATGDGNDYGAVSSGIVLMGKSATQLQTYRAGMKSLMTVPTDGPVRIKSIFNGTTHAMSINGVDGTPVASTGVFGAAGIFSIGASPGGANYCAGLYLTEIIVTNNVLSAPEMASMDAYLLERWNVYAAPYIDVVRAQFNAEGTTLVIPLEAITSFGESVTWSLLGADAARFEISGTVIRWLSNGVKDHEAPNDANTDNVYNLIVRATGATTGLVTDLPLTVTVQDLSEAAPIDVLFDTDFGADCDDSGASGILIKRHLDGDCNLLGVVASSGVEAAAPAVRATLNHYGLTDVPVGARHGAQTGAPDAYAEQVRDTFGNPSETKFDYMDDVQFLRTILSRATRPLTYISVGGCRTMSRLLNSTADAISPLTGAALITAKVENTVVMGGDFPTSSVPEYNIGTDITAAIDVANNWPVPVTWHGADLGAMVNAGPPTVDPDTDPIRKAYFELETDERAAWDLLAVLHAVDGDGALFELDGVDGTVTVAGDGNTSWAATSGNDSYAALVGDPSVHAATLNGILADLITP